MRAPDFVCIGAQKAGTSWLYSNLSGHPDVWLPPVKELHYFDVLYVPGHRELSDQHRAARIKHLQATIRSDPAPGTHDSAGVPAALLAGYPSDDWYKSVFGLAPAASVCGEITPAYAILPPAGVDHLVALAPEVKVLFVVRDPIERAWSQIQMLRRSRAQRGRGQTDPLGPFELPAGVLLRSRYSITLRTYRARIDSRRIWIGDFEQLSTEPMAFLRGVCAFLGVEFDERLFPHTYERVHEGPSTAIDRKIHERLKKTLEPEYEEVVELLPDVALRWKRRHYG